MGEALPENWMPCDPPRYDPRRAAASSPSVGWPERAGRRQGRRAGRARPRDPLGERALPRKQRGCDAVAAAFARRPGHPRVHEAVRGRGDERTVEPAFDDRWSDRAAYLESLAPRLHAVRELLAPHGSMVVHVDPKTSHYVKVLCD